MDLKNGKNDRKKTVAARRSGKGQRASPGAVGKLAPTAVLSACCEIVLFFTAAAVSAALMYAFAAPFEFVWLGYLAAVLVSCAASSALFSRRSGASPAVSAAIWALVSVSVHAAALGILSFHQAHRMPILLGAALSALVCGFLFGRVRRA